jgi:hypothetical protein
MSQAREQSHESPPARRRVSYMISIWSERQRDLPSAWRGSIETAAGQRFTFSTLAELNRLLCELGGWMDPPHATAQSADGSQ